ncbi:transcriptional regulator, TetR family [Paenibacillus sp. UNC496MF]|uniref:TetR/AcrR family transcriptional regulator n=1 Tax=Paenibacillus sp. UNC496MF TaxID=1502753 RepID=UPI0008E502EE|nr:TetR/AcrR family transcriptional regulator [Paenibacillus sp. UNC496MF]SFI35896.1 transcriptional regulator, TetR family [Paenibacillus sp. UNC496MF]
MTNGNQDYPARTKLLKKLIDSFTKEGFQSLRMDDIAKSMDVSRATMYKHFSSKQEVIEGVVRIFIDYIEKLEERTEDGDERSFGIWFQQLFEQSIALVGKISDVFLKDLQAAFPELYDELKHVLHKREEQTLRFYRDGQDRGIFNAINEKFILLQDNVLLREILNVKYLLYNQTTVHEVLRDYYQFKKIQLFKAGKLDLLDDALIEPVIEHFAGKFNRALN